MCINDGNVLGSNDIIIICKEDEIEKVIIFGADDGSIDEESLGTLYSIFMGIKMCINDGNILGSNDGFILVISYWVEDMMIYCADNRLLDGEVLGIMDGILVGITITKK